MNPRARALADHEIDAVVLHRGIHHFFDRWHEAMNFIEKENLARLERGQDRGQVPLALEKRPGAGLNVHAQLARDDLRERRLAEAGWAVEQNVIERLAATARRLDGNLDVLLHARLADVVSKARGANAGFDARVFVKRRACYDAPRGPLHLPFASCS